MYPSLSKNRMASWKWKMKKIEWKEGIKSKKNCNIIFSVWHAILIYSFSSHFPPHIFYSTSPYHRTHPTIASVFCYEYPVPVPTAPCFSPPANSSIHIIKHKTFILLQFLHLLNMIYAKFVSHIMTFVCSYSQFRVFFYYSYFLSPVVSFRDAMRHSTALFSSVLANNIRGMMLSEKLLPFIHISFHRIRGNLCYQKPG